MEPLAFCNLTLIGVICWVSYLGFRSASFEAKYIFWPQAILSSREYYRLVTCGFLHGDGQHLLFNMISLYLFGSQIEFVFGVIPFLTIFFAAVAGGSLLSLLLHRKHDYRAYGASGGVCGIIFANIFLFPGGNIFIFFIPIGIPSWLYAIAFVIFSFWRMKTHKDNIGHDAHMGGALIGLLTTAALYPGIISTSPRLFTAIVFIFVVLLVYVVKNPLFLPIFGFDWMKRHPGSNLPHYKQTERNVDFILEKVSKNGIHSLTPEESQLLLETSGKYQRRATSKKPDFELGI